jgi:UDP-perosamine 4-acetyltransferase
LGAGGHSKVVAEIALQSQEFDLVGLIDQRPVGSLVNGIAVVGSDRELESFRERGVRDIHVAIGSNAKRAELGEMAAKLNFRLATLISPAATISRTARIGDGVVIMGGATLNASCSIGDLTIINTGANVDHDCTIGRAVHIAPGCTLAGSVTVGDRTFLGAAATVIPGVTLGSDVIVGAGACVIRDVPSGQTVVGVPAKVKKSR